MAKLHIQIDNHDGPYTVSEMRRKLAKVLSKLNGDQEVRFMFTAALENYTPAAPVNRRPCFGCDSEPSLAEIIERNCSLLKESLPKISVSRGILFGELSRPSND